MRGYISRGPVQYARDVLDTLITDVTIRIANELEAISPEGVP